MTSYKSNLQANNSENYTNKCFILLTKIKAGDWEAKFLGTLSDGKYHPYNCSDNWEWSNPTVGQKYHYTLVFDETISPDLTNFSSEDATSYTFRKGVADVGENVFVLGYPLRATMGTHEHLV